MQQNNSGNFVTQLIRVELCLEVIERRLGILRKNSAEKNNFPSFPMIFQRSKRKVGEKKHTSEFKLCFDRRKGW